MNHPQLQGAALHLLFMDFSSKNACAPKKPNIFRRVFIVPWLRLNLLILLNVKT